MGRKREKREKRSGLGKSNGLREQDVKHPILNCI